MGISDCLEKRKTDKVLKEQARMKAQEESKLILAQQEEERRKQLQQEAYERELYRQTTPKSQQIQEGLQKAGSKLQGFAQKAGEIGKEFEQQKASGSNLTGSSMGSKFKNSINLDNTLNSKMGNQIFGNSFNQSQDSLKKKIGGFSRKL